MAGEQDDFARLMQSAPEVKPDATNRENAIFQAMEAFDKKISASSKGKGVGTRLMNAIRNLPNLLTGENAMKKSYIIAGGLCAASLAFALMNSSYLTDIVPVPQPKPEAQETVAVDRVSSEEKAVVTVAAPPPAPAAPAPVAPPLPQAEAIIQSTTGGGKAQFAAGANMAMLSGTGGAAQKPEAKRRAAMNSDMALVQPNLLPSEPMPSYFQDQGRDKFENVKANALKLVKEEPVSTFSIDVDTASYSFVRASLNNNVLPPKDAVRIEELVNYFPYEYPAPASREEPFKTTVSVMPTPWNKDTKLLHIGIHGYEMERASAPHANLVFLIDTSGSMNAPNKLPLLRNSLKLLLTTLRPDDTVAIVTYAGSAGTALPPTKAAESAKILAALDNLNAGGSTAGAEGIRLAYQLAEQNLDKNGVNRVLLATDGDFNVGITDPGELKGFIERKRETGIFLSVLGFGMGNYNDQLMQALAQNGNGNAAYIDSLSEARKALVEEAGSTLFPIAKDVKIQVEFNPAKVAEYRLIGYETRLLNREDFNNDKVDAGDIGAGHTVTALYEIIPVGSKAVSVDALRYGKADKKADQPKEVSAGSDEYAFVKLRYKLPKESESKLISTPVTARMESASLAETPAESRFAASVAAFGQLLRGDVWMKDFSWDEAIELAEGAKGADRFGYRAEFISLMRLAKSVSQVQTPQPQPSVVE